MANRSGSTIKTISLTVDVVLLVLVLGAIGVAYSGIVDVGTTSRPWGITRWFLSTTREHSVAKRSANIDVPPLDSPDMIAMGADHYHEMCETCHGAPGVDPSEAGVGLEPPAPKLYRAGHPMSQRAAAMTFWVVKNGIRMTGMPGFGKTHDDHKIWAIVSFLKKMRGMTPDEYKKITAADEGEGQGEEHGEEAGDEHEHEDEQNAAPAPAPEHPAPETHAEQPGS